MGLASWYTATELATAFGKRSLSPVEVVRELLERIDSLDPHVHAYISVDGDSAMDAARQAEKEIFAGRRRGPLHGVPVAVKDIIDIAGLPTSCHSRVMAGHVALRDAAAIARLRAAGAILLGKTALHEFAIGGYADDLPFPAARNPWDLTRHPGGSSSGSGAAVAAGLAPIALGTDTAGSIRNPASMCGVVGLKPTYGLVPRTGVFPLSFTLDHVGPLARCVSDTAMVLNVLAGHDSGDPASAHPPDTAFDAELERGGRGLRIGFVRHFHERDLSASPEVIGSLEEAVRVFRDEGADVQEVQLPDLRRFAGPQRVIFHSESWAIHGRWLRERPGDYCAVSRRKLLPGAFLSAGDYVHAQQSRAELIDAVDAAFRDVDVLLTASSMEPACRADDNEEFVRTYPRQARSPFNLTGHPAVVLMCGISCEGLPLSLQLVGPAKGDATLLRVARTFERATRWHKHRPPLALAESANA